MIDGHGGNVYAAARALGCHPHEIIDMSSNVNPLGPMAALVDFLKDNLDRMTVLPDAAARLPAEQFAANHQLDPRQVLAGNGTTQFIYSLPQALKSGRVLIAGPTYADYADACAMHDVPVTYLLAASQASFQTDVGLLDRRADQFDTIFICNPNNPTGRLIPGTVLRDLCLTHPQTRFVIDESYLPFVTEGEKHSLMGDALQNVIVLQSLSKIFRIPGLRIGFVIASTQWIQLLQPFMLPWNVNALAQAAVAFLTSHPKEVAQFVEVSREHVRTEGRRLVESLQDQETIELCASETLFTLARLSVERTAADLQADLLKQKILIRDCANFKGLSEHYFRISLKSERDNRQLVEALKRFLAR